METDILELLVGSGRGDFREPLELLGWLPPGEMAVLDFLPNMPRMLAVRAIAIDRQVQCDLGVLQGFLVESSRLVATRSTQLRNNRLARSSRMGKANRCRMFKVTDRLVIRAYRRRAPPLRSLAGRSSLGSGNPWTKDSGAGVCLRAPVRDSWGSVRWCRGSSRGVS
jgi:hypothetical protein